MLRDERRTAFLEKRGLSVLRFTNSDVLSNLAAVLEAISDALKAPSLTPALSQGERELD